MGYNVSIMSLSLAEPLLTLLAIMAIGWRLGQQPVRGISNVWITGKVKSKLAVDPKVSALRIAVDTSEDGIVSLHGRVANARVASQAITDAIDVQGVNAVDSYLTF